MGTNRLDSDLTPAAQDAAAGLGQGEVELLEACRAARSEDLARVISPAREGRHEETQRMDPQLSDLIAELAFELVLTAARHGFDLGEVGL